MHKKIDKKLHPYHISKLITNHELTGKQTRNSADVHINEFDKTLAIANSINLKVGTLWNELDPEIKNKAHKVSIATFTKNVKENYISKYSDVCTNEKCYICE